MTTLGSLLKATPVIQPPAPQPLDIGALAVSLAPALVAAGVTGPMSLLLDLHAWTEQDDDAHDTCDALVACRNPLHPGPCKGWKHTLHQVSPGAWKQLEDERVRKANARRIKRIDDLKAQGKPIPHRLLQEIKPKPAPGHPAHGASPVPHGQVNQKADLAGGQAHHAGQSISQAAGIKVNAAGPLPLGPKGKKPSVAGRGPAFVITQPKVTDTYKLDKAAKLTPQDWNALSDGDKKLIRDELAAIKQRGFGPQQKKADELLARLPEPGKIAPGTPNTVTTPGGTVVQKINPTPGKVSLGQAVKQTTPSAPSKTLGTPPTAVPKKVGPDVADQVRKAQDPASQLTPAARLFVYRKLDKATYDSLDDATKKKIADDLDAQTSDTAKKAAADIRQTLGLGAPAAPHPLIGKHVTGEDENGNPVSGILRDVKHYTDPKTGKTTSLAYVQRTTQSGAPHKVQTIYGAKPDTLKEDTSVGAPKAAGHVQHALAVADRTAPKAQMAKTHLDAYGPLSKAEFDALPEKQRNQIRDDLASAKAKFLDPKKQQQAADLLDRFGSRKSVAAPSAPNGAKGYSDPQHEAVKAVSGGAPTDDVLKAVGRLSPDQVKGLSDSDRKTMLGRLAFIATHPKASAEQKEKATAFGRIINSGSPAQGLKRDHTASLAELHADEKKTPALHPAVGEALKAADDAKMPIDNRVMALSGITKAQYDSLKPDEQRKIVDALVQAHAARPSDKVAEKAVTDLTGNHPAVQHLLTAEADYKAGKITAQDLKGAWLTARVQAPLTTHKAVHEQVDKEAQRIAEQNPSLPLAQRAAMIPNDYYGKHNRVYDAIMQASNEFNFNGAPRFSQYDMQKLFAPTSDNLKNVHPIQAEAVQALRVHAISTGLHLHSPWSGATKDQFANAVLGITHSDHKVADDRLKDFRALPAAERALVRQQFVNRLAAQSDAHAQSGTYITLRQLEDKAPLNANAERALDAAATRFATTADLDSYRHLDPADYKAFPQYVQDAISNHLDGEQRRAEGLGATRTWVPSDNPFKVFPAALEAHLNGDRHSYTSRSTRNAADIANYGTKIISPASRVQAYQQVTGPNFDAMDATSKAKIESDLDRIAKDSANPLLTRYGAQFAKDIGLRTPNNPSPLTNDQYAAIAATDPHPSARYADVAVFGALNKLGKSDYDSLPTPFKDAIDERIGTMSGSDQQFLNAKFHPSTAAVNPSGQAPTVNANVPQHVQDALDTIYGTHLKSHTMAHQLKTYGGLRSSEFRQHLNPQEQQHLLSDLSFIATTAKGPSADKAKKLIDRFTPAGTPLGTQPPGAVIPPANAVPGQQRYATPLKGALIKSANPGSSGDGWISTPGGKRVWGQYGAAGLLIKHVDPNSGEERYLMVQRGPAVSDPGKWTFPGGAIDSKESPHEGAARETIEELGLKDDQLKDALVHGDHTYSIPGSTWKYTTVAAQVDKQFTPNLSTAHARAETSDAKWMTIDEIRALDKSGKLHAPIANGLLEQNVVSLYPPKGSGQTLGQVARPGPVTKRQGRLAMPSGGRQSPAAFNAWPHAHKPSKGKNLVADKAAIDKLRQDIKTERKAYDGKTADGRLAAIGARQGFDDTPTVVSKAEMDRLLATGDYIEAWRGVRGTYGGPSAAKINEQMRSGTAWYGRGIFGNGYYLATQKSVAQNYADSSKNSVMRILIPKSAVIAKYKDVQKGARANSSRYSKAKGGSHEEGTLYDAGRWAAANGHDGIQIDHDTTNDTGGWARHVAKPGQPAFNWLNRSVLIIQEAD